MPSIRPRAARCLVAGIFLFLAPTISRATIRYSVSLAQRDQNLLHVTMAVPGVDRELIVAMPVWNALYQVRDFAHRIQGLRAADASGNTLPVFKSDPQTWHVAASGNVTLDYFILWDESSPFSSDINASHAFLNFAEVLLYVPPRRAEDVRLDFSAVPSNWRIALALDPVPPSEGVTASFAAPGYDALVDAPAELGTFEQFSLEAGEAHIDVAVHARPWEPGGRASWSRDRLEDELRRIVLTETRLMRDVPFRRFLFIFHFGGGGGGGMEHANSTAISLEPGADPASTSAHEFFHLWNVKRIRPQSLEPVDYSRAQPTRALWFAEGVTNTIGEYTLLRSGLRTRQQFYDSLAGEIESLAERPARLWQSVEEASVDAWFEKYPLYRRASSSISYYNKGELLGVLLDILLREKTNNRSGLDDLLRDLNERYAKRGLFYDDSAGIRDAAERIAGPDSRQAIDDFFRRYVSETEELPLQDYFSRAGLDLLITDRVITSPGFSLAIAPFGAPGGDAAVPPVVTHVSPGGPAEQAGIRRGDRIVEVNRKPVPPDFQIWLESRSPGETVRLRIRHGDEEREIALVLARLVEKQYSIRESPRANGKTTLPGRIREGICSGSTDQ
jgi:predicted metalloprotease with PDZ domain